LTSLAWSVVRSCCGVLAWHAVCCKRASA
jgi:hypothetical protein